jgi:hypothetical protein
LKKNGTSIFSVDNSGLASTSALHVLGNSMLDGALTVAGYSSFSNDLSVGGSLSVTGSSSFFNQLTAPFFNATSTSVASTFPYASTTALTVSDTASTTALIVSGDATIQNLTATNLISANDITVSGGITLGGVYMTLWPAGGGSSVGSFWATTTNSLIGYPSLAGNFSIVIGQCHYLKR